MISKLQKPSKAQQSIINQMKAGAVIKCFRGNFWITTSNREKCAADVREVTIDKMMSLGLIQYSGAKDRVSTYTLAQESK